MKKGPANKTEKTKEQALKPQSARTLKELIAKNETWLMNQILRYAKARGYTKHTSTLQEAWRLSIAGLSASLLSALKNRKANFELKPDEDYMKDPAASFGIIEAQKHRQRGINLEMFLGLMKYYRESYKDLVRQSNLNSGHKTRHLNKIERFFDRVEIGFCKEWATLSEGEKLTELQNTNRLMTNEKNKYLTAFESLPNPVIILDRDNCVDSMNLAAALLCRESSVPGAEYYKNIVEGGKNSAASETVSLLFPWLSEELEEFTRSDDRELYIEKQVNITNGERSFTIRFSRMLDVSSKFQGSIINLEDVTEQKNTEERLREQEKLQGVLQMAGAICHELTQPMQAISGNAELLLMKMSKNDNKSKKVQNILSQMGRMNNITKKLQAMTRCETKPYVLGGKIIDIYRSRN